MCSHGRGTPKHSVPDPVVGQRHGHEGGSDVLKATQKEPAGSMLWSCLVVMSAVQGLQEEEYGLSSSQKATRAPQEPAASA